MQAGSSTLEKFVLAGGTSRTNGADDSAPRFGNRGIARALQSLLKFVGALAAENQMRMAIDQAGGDDAAASTFASTGDHVAVQVLFRANGFDGIANDNHSHGRRRSRQTVKQIHVSPTQSFPLGHRCLYPCRWSL